MILVDTSIWADHLRVRNDQLVARIDQQLVAMHQFVIGELALGHLRPRAKILRHLAGLPQAPIAPDDRVLAMIETADLVGVGIGYIDAHLLASVTLGAGFRLWTRDRRLHAAALRMGLSFTG